jgi:hypothetical protein
MNRAPGETDPAPRALRNGWPGRCAGTFRTGFQIHSQAVEHYRGTGRSEDAAQLAAAKLEDLASREYCPQFREGFEATYTYETWIKP